jgi:uncharacterized protein YjbI with pentapeptide repeats
MYAQLESASLGGADLSSAVISHAELGECDLSGAKLRKADLSSSNLRSANLEEADLTEATLTNAQLSETRAGGARFIRASLVKVNLSASMLANADLSGADARDANFTKAVLNGAVLTGAKVAGMISADASFSNIRADWLDASAEGDGTRRVPADKVGALLGKAGPIEPSEGVANRRYFGRGDVLRNATLEFDAGACVEVESLFEQCLITLGKGTELIVGKGGVLSDCQITGAGSITINGHFFEKQSPGIVGPDQLVVSAGGALVGAVEQAPQSTRFAFEPGCKLRMKILATKTNGEGRRD